MTNAALVRGWLAEAVGEAKVGAHLAALSTNLPATAAFGIAPDRVFPFRDWVGGRFLPCGPPSACRWRWRWAGMPSPGCWPGRGRWTSISSRRRWRPTCRCCWRWPKSGMWMGSASVPGRCCPMISGWRGCRRIQQVEMESLGKRVTLDGAPVAHPTGPVVFGEFPAPMPSTASCNWSTRAHPGALRHHPGRQSRPSACRQPPQAAGQRAGPGGGTDARQIHRCGTGRIPRRLGGRDRPPAAAPRLPGRPADHHPAAAAARSPSPSGSWWPSVQERGKLIRRALGHQHL